MNVQEVLNRLRDLLHSIEEEDANEISMALAYLGNHIDQKTPAGQVVALEWLRYQHERAFTCWLDSGRVTAVTQQVDQAGKPQGAAVRLWCPVRCVMIDAALHEFPDEDERRFAYCESDDAFQRWAASIRRRRTWALEAQMREVETTETLTEFTFWPSEGDPFLRTTSTTCSGLPLRSPLSDSEGRTWYHYEERVEGQILRAFCEHPGGHERWLESLATQYNYRVCRRPGSRRSYLRPNPEAA